jgi:hypothetical protein
MPISKYMFSFQLYHCIGWTSVYSKIKVLVHTLLYNIPVKVNGKIKVKFGVFYNIIIVNIDTAFIIEI